MTTLPSRPPLYRFYCWSDSDFAFEWILPLILWCREANLLQPIRGTTQIWAVIRHQYGISAPVLQTSIRGEISGRRLFSKALLFREGPGGPAPLIFRPKWGPKGVKKFFWRPPPPPLISGSGWPPHTPPPPSPLIWRSGFATDSCIYFSVNPRRKQSWTSPKSLKLPLQFVAHSFHQV